MHPINIIWLVTGSLALAMGAWLLSLDFQNRLNRALALFLFFDGSYNVFRVIPGDGALALGFRGLAGYMLLAQPFALLYLPAVYRDRYGRPGLGSAALYTLLPLGLAAEIAYFWNHALVGPLFGGTSAGPGGIGLAWLRFFGVSFMAAVLAQDATRAETHDRRVSLLIASTGFAFAALAFVTHLSVPGLMPGVTAWEAAIVATSLFPLAFVVWRLVGFARESADPRMVQIANRYVALLCVPLLSVGALAVVYYTAPLAATRITMVALMAFWTTSLTLIVTYAVVRHELFGIESKIKWTVKRGTMAAIFLGIFFVVAQIAQNLLSERFGWWLGGAAAGLLLFAVAPLQRFAQRVADAAMPGVKPFSDLQKSERYEMYREMATNAWIDGSLSKKERRILDGAAHRLGLRPDEVVVIEREVTAA